MAKKRIKKDRYDIFQNKSKVKWAIIISSVVVSVTSLYYTNYLVQQLKSREKKLVELYAKTLEYTNNDDMDDNLLFITQEILFPNNQIPVILTDTEGNVISSRNLGVEDDLSIQEKTEILQGEIEDMKKAYEPIILPLKDENDEVYDFYFVYYRNSFLLTQLTFYPIIQLFIVAILGVIAYLVFNYSKTLEQNRVWVGLAKETAHQLGTPISSLMAWIEYIKTDDAFQDKSIVEELNKDVEKLVLITERFSNIGSEPDLIEENVYQVVNRTINYLRPRISPKVEIYVYAIHENITAQMNAPLFEWVLENLCKNAVDAMGGSGRIQLRILRGNENRVFVDVGDTGKGIAKSKLNNVFNPGFTTKERGWGLGLTLARRIIEIYHKGRIFVKSSEEGVGTTFRIILNT